MTGATIDRVHFLDEQRRNRRPCRPHSPARLDPGCQCRARETGRIGSVREASVTVRVAANTGYQLVVRGTAVTASRIWVRAVNGEFQELTAGSSVTVARGTRAAGQWDREVQYRIESAGDLNSLPVHYEIALSPQL